MKTPYADAFLKAIKEIRFKKDGIETIKTVPYYGVAETVTIEDNGALKTTVKIIGAHKSDDGDSFLKFIVRFSVYYNEKSVKIMHTFFYDGNEASDFIKGVGIKLTRRMKGQLYNRHIKITGDYGVMHEEMQNYINHY